MKCKRCSGCQRVYSGYRDTTQMKEYQRYWRKLNKVQHSEQGVTQ